MPQQRKETPQEYHARQKRRPITTATNPPLLYIDGFNFMIQFLSGDRGAVLPCDSVDMLSTWKTAEKNIEQLMREATTAGWKVTVFFDNAKIAEDERQTYMDRTKKRFTEGGSAIIPNPGIVLGSLFNRFGAKVRYALGADNDATIAAHAHADDAAILSGDGDFLR